MLNKLQDLRTKKSSEQGFTIIEVMIVLAIAGLILLIVFLAVPALQRNSRNTQRNSEGARMSDLVNECMNNRNGVVGSCDTAAEISWNAGEFQQLTTSPTFQTNGAGAAPTSSTTQAGVWFGRQCNADNSGVQPAASPNPRNYAILYTIENNVTKCIAG